MDYMIREQINLI